MQRELNCLPITMLGGTWRSSSADARPGCHGLMTQWAVERLGEQQPGPDNKS
jgi:hypothetical protein